VTVSGLGSALSRPAAASRIVRADAMSKLAPVVDEEALARERAQKAAAAQVLYDGNIYSSLYSADTDAKLLLYCCCCCCCYYYNSATRTTTTTFKNNYD